MNRLLLLAALLVAFRSAAALPVVEAGVHLGSHHAAPGYNDANPGAYAVLSNGVIFGMYENSESRVNRRGERRVTVYGGYKLETARVRLAGPVEGSLFATAFVATGYARASLVPGGSLGPALHAHGFTLRYHYVPRVAKLNPVAVHSFTLGRTF